MKRLSLKSSFSVFNCVSGFAAMLAFAVVPGTAAAQVPPPPQATLVECSQGNQNQIYAPAIAFFPRMVDVTGTGRLSSCVDSTDPGLASGIFTITGTSTVSCLLASAPTQNVINWNDGTQSTIEFINGVDVRPVGTSMVTILGRVSSGRYQNALAIKTVEVSSVPGVAQCLLGGVRSSSTEISLALLRLF
uniref:Lipoprotein n=1 Tax=Myxococcus fulvus TaxID=33 RepID=A0A7D5SGK2_MYXFU|nr:hypothetical protein [Myxococcus fulvus]QLH55507.1 hypothetical protein [Myxococcus sp.]